MLSGLGRVDNLIEAAVTVPCGTSGSKHSLVVLLPKQIFPPGVLRAGPASLTAAKSNDHRPPGRFREMRSCFEWLPVDANQDKKGLSAYTLAALPQLRRALRILRGFTVMGEWSISALVPFSSRDNDVERRVGVWVPSGWHRNWAIASFLTSSTMYRTFCVLVINH
jgi:hypothetical protein